MQKPLLVAIAMLGIAGCAAPGPRAAVQAGQAGCGPAGDAAAGAEQATLWVRNSAEYRASVEGIYRAALQALRVGLADPAWSAEPSQAGELSGLQPAVIMDIDETVLDNSAAEARALLQHTCAAEFAAAWDAWLAERAAPVIPGAAEFIHDARELEDGLGRPVRVFFITNRECAARPGQAAACPQKPDTLANLRRLGLDTPTLADDLMLKGEQPGWDEKLPRRQQVAQSYRIVLNVGDDLGDFVPEVRRLSLAGRDQARCQYRGWWGTRWFLIPNPMYGSWLRALGSDPEVPLAAPPLPAACAETG